MDNSPVSGASAGGAVAADTTRWTYVGLLLVCGMGAAMQIGKAPPALGALQQDMHLGLVAAAWVISMFSVAGALLGYGVLRIARLGSSPRSALAK